MRRSPFSTTHLRHRGIHFSRLTVKALHPVFIDHRFLSFRTLLSYSSRSRRAATVDWRCLPFSHSQSLGGMLHFLQISLTHSVDNAAMPAFLDEGFRCRLPRRSAPSRPRRRPFRWHARGCSSACRVTARRLAPRRHLRHRGRWRSAPCRGTCSPPAPEPAGVRRGLGRRRCGGRSFHRVVFDPQRDDLVALARQPAAQRCPLMWRSPCST